MLNHGYPSLRAFIKDYIRLHPRALTPRPRNRVDANLFSRAAVAALPWEIEDYPKRRSALREITGAGTEHAVREWWRGRRRAPVYALERLADYLEGRARAMGSVAREIREEIARRERSKGETRAPLRRFEGRRSEREREV